MELTVAFIVHLILSILTNGSAMPRSIYGESPYEQEELLSFESELHGIRQFYDGLIFLKRSLILFPRSIHSRAYLEQANAMMYHTRTVINNYIVNHRERRQSWKVRIARDMMLELRTLQNLIQRRMSELRHAREELPQQHQLRENLRSISQQQEPEHPSSSTELSDLIQVIMPGSDRITHVGIRRSTSGTQQQNEGSSSNAGSESG